MKKSVLFFITICASATVIKAQESVKYCTDGPTVFVSPVAQNILWRGIENPLDVEIPSVPAEDLVRLTTTNGEIVIHEEKSWKYHVIPGDLKICDVKVSYYKGEYEYTTNYGIRFRVKDVPDPEAYFAGVTGNATAEKTKLMAGQGIITKMNRFGLIVRFEVTSFTFSTTLDGQVKELHATGPRITSEMKTMVKALEPGAKLYVENIKVKGTDGTSREVSPIVVKVN